MILSMPFPGSKTKNRGTAAKGENVSLWTDTALQESMGKNGTSDLAAETEKGESFAVQLLSNRPRIMKKSWKTGSRSF